MVKFSQSGKYRTYKHIFQVPFLNTIYKYIPKYYSYILTQWLITTWGNFWHLNMDTILPLYEKNSFTWHLDIPYVYLDTIATMRANRRNTMNFVSFCFLFFWHLDTMWISYTNWHNLETFIFDILIPCGYRIDPMRKRCSPDICLGSQISGIWVLLQPQILRYQIVLPVACRSAVWLQAWTILIAYFL